MTEHTWTVGKPRKFHNQHYIPIQEQLMGDLMTDVCWVVSGEETARFIVTACNSHANLLEASKRARNLLADIVAEGAPKHVQTTFLMLSDEIRKVEEAHK